MPQLNAEAQQQYSLAIDGRLNDDAPKVNWNNLHTTFRPRSGRQTPYHGQLDPAELCWSGGSAGRPSSSRAPAALAARPKSAGFPARSHRRARRRGGPSAEEAAAAAAAAAAESEELAEMWRLDDEDTVELDDIFDQLARRGDTANTGATGEKQRKKPQKLQQQQQQQQQRPWRPRTGVRSSKSATQLYQEHLLAEVAKHRLKAASGQRRAGTVPPELALFIPKTRTRLCRLFTGPCLLRSGSGPAGASASGSFLPIARPIAPLPAELRPLSRQSWTAAGGGGSRGGVAQVSSDGCNCRAAAVASGFNGRSRLVASSNYSDNCAVCQRLRTLQLA